MAIQDSGLKYVKYVVNGQTYYDAISNTGQVPYGSTELNYNDFLTGARQQGISALERYKQGQIEAPGVGQANRAAALKAFNEYGGQSALDALTGGSSDFNILARATGLKASQFQPNQTSGITMVNGIPTDIKGLESQQANASNPNMINIGTAQAPMYVPKGSPAEANLPNIGTQNTANQANVSQGTSTTEKPPKYAPFAISSNLQYGSRGDDVKELQTYLKGLQLYDGKVDGIFGNITMGAVKTLQGMLGVTADGVVGKNTVAGINAYQGGQQAPPETQAGYKAPDDPSNAFNTETGQPNPEYKAQEEKNPLYDTLPPELKALYDQLKLQLDQQLERGNRVNPDLSISPKMTQRFLDQASSELSPYYKEILRQSKQDLTVSTARLMEDYNKNVAREQPQFEQNLESQQNQEASSGTAFSSGRVQREQNLVQGQNERLGDLATNTQRGFENLAIQGERNLGSRNFGELGIPSLSSYSASAQNRTIAPTGSRQLYQPQGGLFGELPAQEKTAISGRGSELEELERKKRILDYSAGGGGLGSTSLG